MSFNLQIISPEKSVFDEEVDDYQLTRAFDLILAINLINTRTEQ